MAKRGTKAQEQEIIWVFSGINPKTRRVESVSQQRNGVLSKTGENGAFVTHHVSPGRKAETEIVIVWGFTDIFSTPAHSWNSDYVKQKRAELEEKAAKLREEADPKE
jgi:hypothetical protein